MNLRGLLFSILLVYCSGTAMYAQKISFVYNLSSAVGPNYQVMESVEMGGKLYFSTWADSGTTLWVLDGGAVNKVYHWGYYPSDYALNKLYVYGNKLLFTGIDSVHGKELWISDGTSLGTILLKDLVVGSKSAYNAISSFIYNSNEIRYHIFVQLNGKVYFAAGGDGVNASEIYETDGTALGTRVLNVFPQLSKSVGPGRNMSVVGGKLLTAFATSPSTCHLYYTEGPFINSAVYASNVCTEDFFYWDSKMLCTAPYGNGLLVTNRNNSGIIILDSAITMSSDYVWNAKSLYFFNGSGNMYLVDSSLNGISLIKGGLGAGFGVSRKLQLERKKFYPVLMKDKLYFCNGKGLWTSDGTATGTMKVIEYAHNASLPWYPTFPTSLTHANGQLFFRGFDSTRVELFMSDGTENGTKKLRYPGADFVDSTFFMTLYPGVKGYQPYHDIMIPYGNSLFFTASYSNGVGKALYRLDFSNNVPEVKKEGGTSLIAFPNPGNGSIVSLVYPAGKYDRASVMDGTGRVVFDQPVAGSGQSTIKLSHLVSGTYFIQVVGKGGRLTTPFVLQR